MLDIRLAMSRGRFAKAAPSYVSKGDARAVPDRGDGEKHLPADPMTEIEALAAQHRKTPAGQGMTKEKAVAHIVQSTDRGRALYAQHRDDNLRRQKCFTLERAGDSMPKFIPGQRWTESEILALRNLCAQGCYASNAAEACTAT